MGKPDLDELRNKIDEIDSRLLSLLEDRAQLARQVGEVKKAGGAPSFAPVREDSILDAVAARARSFPASATRAVFREVISGCRAVQTGLTVAFLGPEATFTHQAALTRFGGSARLVACGSIPMVFREVARDGADFGVVPVENSHEGAVSHTLDSLVQTDLHIAGELILPIEQCLLGRAGDIEVIYSHPQALGQCARFLAQNFSDCELVAVSSTAEAARQASEADSAAAIGSALAGQRYGLQVLRRSIQDSSDNRTRFFIIGRESTSAASGACKTSLVITLHDRPGSLYRVLAAFAESDVNLSKIESRPSRQRSWDYVFFVDVQGHQDDQDVKDALSKVAEEAECRVIGSYPCVS